MALCCRPFLYLKDSVGVPEGDRGAVEENADVFVVDKTRLALSRS
jgi:hypothetical protein